MRFSVEVVSWVMENIGRLDPRFQKLIGQICCGMERISSHLPADVLKEIVTGLTEEAHFDLKSDGVMFIYILRGPV